MSKASARLLSKQVSISKKLPRLSSDGLNLFLLMIPHFNSHGKMNGDPFFIKGEVVPRFDRFTVPKIKKCLKEISKHTNVKWFESEGLWYLQSISFKEHQPGLREDRMGEDTLPSYILDNKELQEYSGTNPESLPPEVEVEVEDEVEVEGKYGVYKHITLTRNKYEELKEFHGEDKLNALITILDEGIDAKDYKYKRFFSILKTGWPVKELERREKENNGQGTGRHSDIGGVIPPAGKYDHLG
jgi:hypothetical protein